jgi:hypothetical protein
MALAFVASDLGNTNFGGVTNTDRMAVVGGEAIPISDLTVSANNALAQVRQRNPTLTMPEFIAEGSLDEVVKQMIDRFAVGQYGKDYGLRAGENLVNSEILQIQAFQGLTGQFDQQTYLAAIGQRGLTDATFRRDLAIDLIEQQLLRSAVSAPRLPEKVARQYAALVLEKRKGEIALIPSAAFAPAGNPSTLPPRRPKSPSGSSAMLPNIKRPRAASSPALWFPPRTPPRRLPHASAPEPRLRRLRARRTSPPRAPRRAPAKPWRAPPVLPLPKTPSRQARAALSIRHRVRSAGMWRGSTLSNARLPARWRRSRPS